MGKIVPIIFYYLTFSILDLWLLVLIDIKIHHCTYEETNIEFPNYLLSSIFWPVTMPIGLVYVIISLFEKINKREIKNKEYKVAISSWTIIIIGVIILLYHFVLK